VKRSEGEPDREISVGDLHERFMALHERFMALLTVGAARASDAIGLVLDRPQHAREGDL